MSRRELWLSVALVGAVALVVRIVAASLVPFPIPEDTAYYHGVARNLVEGRGLVTDALWTYQGGDLSAPPRPAFDVWMPLPTFLAAIPMAIFGTDYRIAQIVAVLVGTLVPILTWRLALDVADDRGLPRSRSRVFAIGAGLTAAVELPLLLHSTLLDSTALFAVFVLLGCLLMPRILGRAPAATWRAAIRDPRLFGLGVVIGLGALTRNEAIWIGGTWFLLILFAMRGVGLQAGRSRLAPLEAVRLVGVPAVVALLIFAPWGLRDLVVLSTPFPSQTLTNALSVSGFDIFAFTDPPTVSRYLGVGLSRLVQMRIDGGLHNLVDVLLLPSFPVGIIGLLALPWLGRGRALRPLVIISLITFAFTTLAFPVSTTWGTYLHAAGVAHVLLIITCLLALDAFIVRVGRFRGWTRPVAWLGPTLTIAAALLFSAVLLPSFGAQSRNVQDRYEALPGALASAGLPPLDQLGPVISDHPIWWAEAFRQPALGLPDEPPSSVLALARTFPGTRYVVISSRHGRWPDVLSTTDPDAACFREIVLKPLPNATAGAALDGTHVYELVCP